MQKLIEAKVQAGEYASAEEMMHAGLVKLLEGDVEEFESERA
jgi:Arc/MetJ-type ribon-helix-helix transcriptional regulator